jgi:hypothetical protein
LADSTKIGTLNITIFRRKATAISIVGTDTVDIGATTALSAKFTPSNTTYQKVIWTVSDESIATVDNAGTVTGVAKGHVTVTATSFFDPTVSGTIDIKVTQNFIYQTLSLVNPGFELPGDNYKYYWFNGDSIPGWHSDETRRNMDGRQPNDPNHAMRGSYFAWSNNTGAPIYQLVDTVARVGSKYLLTYLAKIDYNNGGSDSVFAFLI